MKLALELIVVLIGVSSNLSGVFGLDESEIRDLKCLEGLTVDPTIDWDWIKSVKGWHVPLWNKLELYRTASDITGKPLQDLTSEDVAFPCVYMNNTYAAVGFGRTDRMQYTVEIDTNNVQDFKATSFDGTKSGRSFNVLTDNVTFIFGITCWEDGEAGWAVLSSTQSISPFVKKVVMNYIVEKGFNPALAVESGYDLCDGKGSPLFPKKNTFVKGEL